MMHPTIFNPDVKSHHQNQIMSEEDHQRQPIIIINSSCPISWKVYENPFFAPTNVSNNNYSTNPLKLKPKQLQRKYSATAKYIHSSDLKMNNNNNNNNILSNVSWEVGTQVAELKAELEMERKKMEALKKKLSRDEVEKEKEISGLKEEMEKMKKEMEEERKMLRMAEVLREERVQMKLSDAHLFYHHLNNKLSSDDDKCSGKSVNLASPEAENPHIKQGIKGFVEFQRAIKAKNGTKQSSTDNLECQKAQLRLLFKNKYPLPYSNHDHLIIS